jgi:two-component system, cell cycle sensor histidine kinase and response regulator CckA
MPRRGANVPRPVVARTNFERAAALHDLRNLLLLIETCSELAYEEADPRTELYTDLSDIREAAQRASSLIDEVEGRITKRVREARPVDIMITQLLPILRRLAGPSVRIEYEGRAANAIAALAPAALERVLINLVANARDAMADAGTVRIETTSCSARAAPGVTHAEARSFVRVAVQDTGPGMDDTTVARVFDPYFTTKAPGKGTGLGLPSVRRLAEKVGGRVWITTRLGGGTTVFVDLPTAEPRCC